MQQLLSSNRTNFAPLLSLPVTDRMETPSNVQLLALCLPILLLESIPYGGSGTGSTTTQCILPALISTLSQDHRILLPLLRPPQHPPLHLPRRLLLPPRLLLPQRLGLLLRLPHRLLLLPPLEHARWDISDVLELTSIKPVETDEMDLPGLLYNHARRDFPAMLAPQRTISTAIK